MNKFSGSKIEVRRILRLDSFWSDMLIIGMGTLSC